MYQITILSTLNLHNFICQLCLSTAGRKIYVSASVLFPFFFFLAIFLLSICLGGSQRDVNKYFYHFVNGTGALKGFLDTYSQTYRVTTNVYKSYVIMLARLLCL